MSLTVFMKSRFPYRAPQGKLDSTHREAPLIGGRKDPEVLRFRPHVLRHTYGTQLRQGGADVAQVQALLGHASLETSARYFRAGAAEQAAVVDTIFEQ
ncbi:tyrosine-type recombinase/integrase [Nocardia rhamnosiphila]